MPIAARHKRFPSSQLFYRDLFLHRAIKERAIKREGIKRETDNRPQRFEISPDGLSARENDVFRGPIYRAAVIRSCSCLRWQQKSASSFPFARRKKKSRGDLNEKHDALAVCRFRKKF